MKNESPNISIIISREILEAIAKTGESRSVFFRKAACDRLAKDFGVVISPELPKAPRIGQGKRNDIAGNPERLEQLRVQAAKMRESRWKKE
jgi:hypothetical protein